VDAYAERFQQSAAQLNATLQARLEIQLMAAVTCASQQAATAVHALAASNGSSAWRWDAAAYDEFQARIALACGARVAADVRRALLSTFHARRRRAALDTPCRALQLLGSQLVALSHARTLNWNVLLVGEAQRAAYEAAATEAAGGLPDALLAHRLAGGLSDNLTATAPSPVALSPRYLPIFDLIPASGRSLVNFDILSSGSTPERRAACDTAAATGVPAATDLLRGTFLAGGVYAPATTVFAPALAPGAPVGTPPFGVCALSFEWAAILADALPAYAGDIAAVITSASGRQATLQLTSSGATALEPGGDLHDRSLDAWVQTFSMQLGGDAWSLTLYPTCGPTDNHSLEEPERNAGVIVACVTACALIFAFYELHVRRRSGVLIAALAANLKEVVAMKAEVERAAAQEASAQQRLLTEGNRQKDEFVSMVSHEARTRRRCCLLALQRRDG
jgi:hypothetical protein